MGKNKIIETVVDIARLMYNNKMVTTYEGNISIKDGDKVYITPTTQCKGRLTSNMVVTIDMQGNTVGGTYPPSSEYKMHLEFYRLRPDITSVCHTHSPYATAFACCRMPIQSKCYFEPIVMFDKIPVADYGQPETEMIYKGIGKYVNHTEVMLLANHGVVAYHRDPYEAFYHAEAAESIAKVLTITKHLGGGYNLNKQDMADLYELRKKSIGRSELVL
jgi:L-fuculose-phosphate aldolase